MAARLISSPRATSCNGPYALLFVVVVLLLLVGCGSARPAPATMAAAAHKILQGDSARRTRNFSPEYNMGFRYGGQVFSFLPKGVPVPPSGPSKRHNSLVNSAPGN